MSPLQSLYARRDVWLTQKQMADLFQTNKQSISLHLQNVFDEGELAADLTVLRRLIRGQRNKTNDSQTVVKFIGKLTRSSSN